MGAQDFALRFRPALADDWDLVRDAIGDRPVMVTANQVAHARTALAARLVQHAGFRIDPVPYRLDPANRWSEGKRGLKEGYRRLDAAYAEGLGRSLIATAPDWCQFGPDLTRTYVRNVLRFQLNQLLRQTREMIPLFSSQELMDVERGLRPGALLAPYVPLLEPTDLAQQVAIWRETPTEWEGSPVEAVIAVGGSLLRFDVAFQALKAAVEEIPTPTTWLWFIGDSRSLRPEVVGDRLLRRRRLVHYLSERAEVRLLHAGFMELELHYDGATEAAFGPSLSSPGLRGGGGGFQLGLFYSLAKHRQIGYREARDILGTCRTVRDVDRELCSCEMCHEAFALSPQEYSALFFTGTPIMRSGQPSSQELASSQSAALNRFHGLFVRAIEAHVVGSVSRASLATALMAATLNASGSDAAVLRRLGNVLLPETA